MLLFTVSEDLTQLRAVWPYLDTKTAPHFFFPRVDHPKNTHSGSHCRGVALMGAAGDAGRFVFFRVKGPEKEEKLRRTVTQVLKCDVTQRQPLGGVRLRAADCLLSTLCLHAACPDLPAYRAALSNLSSLLRPGGALVLADALRSSFYTVCEQRFSSLCLGPEAVKAAVKEAGYTIEQFEVISQSYSSTTSDSEGLFLLVGRKLGRSV